MRTRRAPGRTGETSSQPRKQETTVLIVPQQSPDAIRRRHGIREDYHDSKALTITAAQHIARGSFNRR
jgi:hypothetical protein